MGFKNWKKMLESFSESVLYRFFGSLFLIYQINNCNYSTFSNWSEKKVCNEKKEKSKYYFYEIRRMYKAYDNRKKLISEMKDIYVGPCYLIEK